MSFSTRIPFLALVCVGPVAAQGTASLPAVTITAEKSERALHEVPASVFVLDGEALEREGIHPLATTPSLAGAIGVCSKKMTGYEQRIYPWRMGCFFLRQKSQ